MDDIWVNGLENAISIF